MYAFLTDFVASSSHVKTIIAFFYPLVHYAGRKNRKKEDGSSIVAADPPSDFPNIDSSSRAHHIRFGYRRKNSDCKTTSTR